MFYVVRDCFEEKFKDSPISPQCPLLGTEESGHCGEVAVRFDCKLK